MSSEQNINESPSDRLWARHGGAKNGHETGEYKVWAGIKRRCFNANDSSFENYGGRGITMNPTWRISFAAFLRDVGERPSSRHSLDRINPNGNYEPGNVRWATPKEQQNNRRNNRRVTVNGETMTIAQWADKTGITSRIIHFRIWRLGWTPEDAVTTPRKRTINKSECAKGHVLEGVDLYVSPSGRRMCMACFRDRREVYRRGERVRTQNIKTNSVDENTRNKVIGIFGMSCHICKDAIQDRSDLHIDHVLPLSRGGTSDIENLRPAHSLCNRSKGNRV